MCMADLDNLTLQDAFKTPDTAWPIELLKLKLL